MGRANLDDLRRGASDAMPRGEVSRLAHGRKLKTPSAGQRDRPRSTFAVGGAIGARGDLVQLHHRIAVLVR